MKFNRNLSLITLTITLVLGSFPIAQATVTGSDLEGGDPVMAELDTSTAAGLQTFIDSQLAELRATEKKLASLKEALENRQTISENAKRFGLPFGSLISLGGVALHGTVLLEKLGEAIKYHGEVDLLNRTLKLSNAKQARLSRFSFAGTRMFISGIVFIAGAQLIIHLTNEEVEELREKIADTEADIKVRNEFITKIKNQLPTIVPQN